MFEIKSFDRYDKILEFIKTLKTYGSWISEVACVRQPTTQMIIRRTSGYVVHH